MNKIRRLLGAFGGGRQLPAPTPPVPTVVEAIAYRNYNKIRNFGDSINPWLIERLFNRPVHFSPPEVPHVLPIGSIFFAVGRQSHVWGSGIVDPGKAVPPFDPAKVHAVRGELTLALLRSLGHAIADVPLGDPGFLVSEVMPAGWRQRSSRYRAAVIPHHMSWHHAAFDPLRRRRDVALIDMMSDDPDILLQIADAEVVVSESLHGLIFGAALGKPTAWISRRDTEKWAFKFRDWQSTCRRPQTPLSFEAGFDNWVAAAEIADVLIDKPALLAAFPLPQVLRSVAGPLLGFDACRKTTPVVVRAKLFEADGLRSHPLDAPLPQLAAQVASIVSEALRRHSYPTYVAIVPPDTDVPRDIIERACRELDEDTRQSFVSIARQGSGPAIAVRHKKRLLGGALVIRPNGRFDPAAPFLTLEYRTGWRGLWQRG